MLRIAAVLLAIAAPLPGTWELLDSPNDPRARMAPMVYDSERREVLIVGGYGLMPETDLIAWAGLGWSVDNRYPPAIAPGIGVAAAYDPVTATVHMVGGLPSFPTAILPVPYHWLQDRDADVWSIASSHISYDLARWSATLTADPIREQIVLFGGNHTRAGPTWIPSSDLWLYDSWEGTWDEVMPSKPWPFAREDACAAWSPERKAVVLFGGRDAEKRILGDTWIWNGSKWSRLLGNGPQARRGAGFAYHADAKALVLFGGNDGTNNRNDAWAFTSSGWKRVQTSGPKPLPRYRPGLASNKGGNVLMFGGHWSLGWYLFDTWRLRIGA